MLIQCVVFQICFFGIAYGVAIIPNTPISRAVKTNDLYDKINGRIAGGETATPGQFPHQVALRRKLFGNFYPHCGGSIITNRWVLTAAHCTAYSIPENIGMFMGAQLITDKEFYYETQQNIFHQEFVMDYDVIRNDIALLQTVQTIVFTDKIAPISLGRTFLGAGLPVQTSGWGVIDVT